MQAETQSGRKPGVTSVSETNAPFSSMSLYTRHDQVWQCILRGTIMQKVVLLSLALIANSGVALAATPVFQLHENGARSQLRAIDIISPKPEGDAALGDLQMPSHTSHRSSSSASRGGAFISNVLYNPASPGGWSKRQVNAGVMPLGNSIHAEYADYDVPSNNAGIRLAADDTAGGATVGLGRVASADDSLFYFLKNFKARPLQRPASGTMLLVGLCFVLYQMRRRPMRSSIGFNTAAKLMDRHAA
jgi:hypothetical protein